MLLGSKFSLNASNNGMTFYVDATLLSRNIDQVDHVELSTLIIQYFALPRLLVFIEVIPIKNR